MPNYFSKMEILITAQTDQMVAGLNKVNSAVTKTDGMFRKVGAGLAGYFAAGKMIAFAKASLEATDVLFDQSRRLGMTAAEFEGLNIRMQIAGMTAGEASVSFDYFNRQLGELEGGSEKVEKTLARIGLSKASLEGKDFAAKLEMVDKALHSVNTETRASAVDRKSVV